MAFSFGLGGASSNTSGSSYTTKQRLLNQEGMTKLITDILSSDQGLAALAQGENTSGTFSSTTKALLAQNLVTQIAGELANITAPEVIDTTQTSKTKEKAGKLGSVICTELNRQGFLPDFLYNHPRAKEHFAALPPSTVAGYRAWANKCVPVLAANPDLASRISFIAIARYEMIVSGKWNLVGALTIYVAQPICNVIGKFLAWRTKNGNIQSAT